jgi:hypothetical protein
VSLRKRETEHQPKRRQEPFLLHLGFQTLLQRFFFQGLGWVRVRIRISNRVRVGVGKGLGLGLRCEFEG